MLLFKLFYPLTSRSIKSLFMALLIIFNSAFTYAEPKATIDAATDLADKSKPGPHFLICGATNQAGLQNSFSKTILKLAMLEKKLKAFTDMTCSVSAVDIFLSSSISNHCSGLSGHGSAGCSQDLGNQSTLAKNAKAKECKDLENDIEIAEKDVLKVRDTERQNCITHATFFKSRDLVSCKETVNQDYAHNLNACAQFGHEVQTKAEKLLAFAQEHWIAIAGLLTVVGGGAIALSSAGKKASDDLTTNPMANATDPKNTVTPPPQQTAETATSTADATPTFQRPSDQAYCQNSIRPVECFVTPACDLTCAAARYGVDNYGGMASDTRMIDKNGKIVDPTTTRARNPGAPANTASSAGSGGGSSSKSGSGPGEIANSNTESAANEPITTRNARSFDYDDSGFGSGRGFGSDSDSLGRDPATASARSLALMQGVQAKDLAAAATGPVLQSKENIFNLIFEASRTQCVRDLVDCSGN